MIFQQISFQRGQCMLKQALFSLKTWNKHESRKISCIGTFPAFGSFPANFDKIHRHRATYWKSTYFPIVQLTPYPSDYTRCMAPGQLTKPWRCIYQHCLPRNPIEAAIPIKDRVFIWLCHWPQLWYRVATYAVFVLCEAWGILNALQRVQLTF